MAKHKIVGFDEEGKEYDLERDVESEELTDSLKEWELFFDGKLMLSAIPQDGRNETTWQAV
jgi:hypothetical protein